MKTYADYITLACGLLVLAATTELIGWHYHRSSHVAFSYTWLVEYGTMPAGDADLADWLKSRTGVLDASVTRDGHFLSITCDVTGGQPVPKALEEAEILGYSERGSSFSDVQIKSGADPQITNASASWHEW